MPKKKIIKKIKTQNLLGVGTMVASFNEDLYKSEKLRKNETSVKGKNFHGSSRGKAMEHLCYKLLWFHNRNLTKAEVSSIEIG